MDQQMKIPEITIITPVWNGMPFLKECVDSVLMQSFQNWEMIISDDGSTDGSRDYLATLTDARIKIFKQENNKGIFGNLNWLFEQALAPVCQILCQDDYFVDKDSLRLITSYWTQAPANIGFARFNHGSIGKCSLTMFQKEILPEIINSENSALLFYLFGNIPGNLSNVTLRTRIVKECNGFDQKLPYAGDFDFWSRAARKYSMGIQNDLVVFVRRHEGVASNHLNKKGELLAQKSKILSGLYEILASKMGNDATRLKMHGTINFDTQQRYNGIKRRLFGSGTYLSELDKVSDSSNFILPPAWRWFLFVATLGGKIGRVRSAKQIMAKNNVIFS